MPHFAIYIRENMADKSRLAVKIVAERAVDDYIANEGYCIKGLKNAQTL